MGEHLIIRGNFLGATIVAVIYTVYILAHMSTMTKFQSISALVILNALTIILMHFAFRYV